MRDGEKPELYGRYVEGQEEGFTEIPPPDESEPGEGEAGTGAGQ